MLVAAPQKSVFNVYNYCCYDPPDCYCCCCVVVFPFVFIAFVRCVNLKPTQRRLCKQVYVVLLLSPYLAHKYVCQLSFSPCVCDAKTPKKKTAYKKRMKYRKNKNKKNKEKRKRKCNAESKCDGRMYRVRKSENQPTCLLRRVLNVSTIK